MRTRLGLQALVIGVALWAMVAWVQAAVPKQVAFQGKLTDANGTPLQGDVAVTFRLYDAAIGGTKLWEETQTLKVSGGLFNALLGSVSALNLPFDRSYWVELQVGTETLTPRQPLAASPYALRAQNLDGVNVVDGRVGIGTANPTVPMHFVKQRSDPGGAFGDVARYEYVASNTAGPTFNLIKRRGTSAAPASVQAGDSLGQILFEGQRGSNVGTTISGAISAVVDAPPNAATIPTALVFSGGRVSDGNQELMRIASDGHIGIGTSTPRQKLEVNGAVRLAPVGAPADPTSGTIYFDSASSHFFGFDGTRWKQLDN